MKQVWLISYSHPDGFGRFINTRQDDKRPSFADIEAMEKKICKAHNLREREGTICVISVSRLQDEE